MSYMVYHKEFSPEYLVNEKDYINYLLTGEWFDRPQTNNEGNRDETKRLLDNAKRVELEIESRSQQLQRDGREILCDTSIHQSENDGRQVSDLSSNQSDKKEILLAEKKRGRPKKVKLNGEQNN